MSCCICYNRVAKNSFKCVYGEHYTCTTCLAKGNLIKTSSWPMFAHKCSICRQTSFYNTDTISDIKLARIVIENLQEKLREIEDDIDD